MPFDPDRYGRWRNVAKPCSCPCSKLRAIKFFRIECDFMDREAKEWGNAGRVAAGVGSLGLAFIPIVGPFLAVGAIAAQAKNWGEDMTHTALEVHFKCEQCGQIAYKTYEILRENVTSNRWGRYTKTYGGEQIGGIDTTEFDEIEQVFRDMPKEYNFAYNNCKDWTSEMTRRL